MPSLHPGLALLPFLLAGVAVAQAPGAPRPGATPPGGPAGSTSAGEADPQADSPDGPVRSYTVTLMPTGNGALDTAIEAVSALQRLRESVPTSAEGLVARALQDLGQLRNALRSEGYYDGTPTITLAGEPPDAPNLALRLAARGPEPVPVVIGARTGPLYRVSTATLRPFVPETDIAEAGEVAGLGPGDPARAAAVNGAQETLLTRLREAGHPFASVPGRDITVDHDTKTMEIVYRVQPGPRARFAQPVVEGSENVSQDLLRRASGVLAGQPYDPRELDRMR